MNDLKIKEQGLVASRLRTCALSATSGFRQEPR